MPCVFCGRPGLTREHVWPQWVRRVIADPPAEVMVRRRGMTIDPMLRPGPPFDLVVRRVCRDCNGGWMARLEDEVKPLLTPFLCGRGRVLHRGGQELIAAWALKTAMMLEFSHPRGAVIPHQHRQRLYHDGKLPDHCQVWIGLYSGRQLNTFYWHDHHRWPGTRERPALEAYGILFGIRHLTLQLWCPERAEYQLENLPPLSQRLHRIHPYRRSVTVGPPTLGDQHIAVARKGQHEPVSRAEARRRNITLPRVL